MGEESKGRRQPARDLFGEIPLGVPPNKLSPKEEVSQEPPLPEEANVHRIGDVKRPTDQLLRWLQSQGIPGYWYTLGQAWSLVTGLERGSKAVKAVLKRFPVGSVVRVYDVGPDSGERTGTYTTNIVRAVYVGYQRHGRPGQSMDAGFRLLGGARLAFNDGRSNFQKTTRLEWEGMSALSPCAWTADVNTSIMVNVSSVEAGHE